MRKIAKTATDLRPPKLRRKCETCGAEPGSRCTSTRPAQGAFPKVMKTFHDER